MFDPKLTHEGPFRLKPSSMINKETTVTLRPARKTRSKTRKPKFLSLREELSPENAQQSGQMTISTTTSSAFHHHHLNLFPLHPDQNIVEEKDNHHENVEYFFSAADCAATTLTGLLAADTSSSDEDNNRLSPSSLTYACGVHEYDSEEGYLVRTALRNKERDAETEEKWVCYSEVVEIEKRDEEVSSCAADRRYKTQTQLLSLKLDYEEIINAWSDKGPLYIHVESPQTVPDLQDDEFLSHAATKGPMHGWSNNGGLWTVPEMSGSNSSSGRSIKVKEEVEVGGEERKMGRREASVLRYKEKRQNRLFSKKIRYQVRKLNAEKRPRIKGRFVKREVER